MVLPSVRGESYRPVYHEGLQGRPFCRHKAVGSPRELCTSLMALRGTQVPLIPYPGAFGLVGKMQQLVIQLDDERRKRLEELGKERGVSVTEALSGLIDDAYTDFVQERRKRAATRLIGLGVEIPPDPVTLSRELEAAHQPCGLPFN